MTSEGHRPVVGCGEAAALAAKHFSIQPAQGEDRPSCKELDSYGDRNFYLRSGAQLNRSVHPAEWPLQLDTRMHTCDTQCGKPFLVAAPLCEHASQLHAYECRLDVWMPAC